MWVELWERFRGYDKWIAVEAKIASSEVHEVEHSGRGGRYVTPVSEEELVWCDDKGEEHRADFSVSESSSLFQRIGGETVKIRYNPADPEEFYFPELAGDRLRAWMQGAAVIVGIALFFILSIWASVRH
jgi:hypothetical protein